MKIRTEPGNLGNTLKKCVNSLIIFQTKENSKIFSKHQTLKETDALYSNLELGVWNLQFFLSIGSWSGKSAREESEERSQGKLGGRGQGRMEII